MFFRRSQNKKRFDRNSCGLLSVRLVSGVKEFSWLEQISLRKRLIHIQVKQMMEEAVMKKCIHEENCSITTLCGSSKFIYCFFCWKCFCSFSAAVEACLLHGLKRRAVGLFKTNTTMGLLQKISKSCPPANEVMKLIDEQNQQNDEASMIFSLPRLCRDE